MERTLSDNESRVILDLEWRERQTVTLAEVKEILGTTEGYARYLTHRLVSKGWLERIRPGLFQLIPAARGREGAGDQNPLAAGAVLISPYFYSFGTACTHHGLTEQTFSEIYIACRRHRRPMTLRGKTYVFVHVSTDRLFGFESTSVLERPVEMATLERSLLDAIDRPHLAGGIGEVSRIAMRASPRVRWPLLLEYLGRWDSSALVQRLGYLLDLHGIELEDRVRSRLQGLARKTSKIHLGPRKTWGTHGRVASRWNVIENVPGDVLISRDETPRRKVVLRRQRSSSDSSEPAKSDSGSSSPTAPTKRDRPR